MGNKGSASNNHPANCKIILKNKKKKKKKGVERWNNMPRVAFITNDGARTGISFAKLGHAGHLTFSSLSKSQGLCRSVWFTSRERQ